LISVGNSLPGGICTIDPPDRSMMPELSPHVPAEKTVSEENKRKLKLEGE
jgi:hypothetical protein